MNGNTHRHGFSCTRRGFIAVTGTAVLGALMPGRAGAALAPIAPHGPASKYVPRVQAAFVRRQGEYGLRWPGAVYDGETALKTYRDALTTAAKEMGVDLTLLETPLYSQAEGEQWIAQAEAQHLDGLFLVLLDRQEHAWPVAARAVDSPLPAVIFSPIGTSFTLNTAPLASKSGAYICSTDDFSQGLYGLKMLRAGAKLRETRFIVIKGEVRKDQEMDFFGAKLRYIPASHFLELYEQTPESDEVRAIADEYLTQALSIHDATRQDVINGVKSFVVARRIMEEEEGDAITMDCLGALGKSTVSLPCIAWSRMLDHGIAAACEADLGACITHALVQALFDRPGFEQDPVADTAQECLIGAHCTCPTRLNGFNAPPEPFHLANHHGNRDAVPIAHWRTGQRVTIADVEPSENSKVPPRMIISAGTVVDQVSVPPAGGCVASVRVKLDGVSDVLTYPGMHQLFLYGDFKRELAAYCRLFKITPLIV